MKAKEIRRWPIWLVALSLSALTGVGCTGTDNLNTTPGVGGGQAKACTDGSSESRTRFEKTNVNPGQECKKEEQKRTCSGGAWGGWVGSYAYESCQVDAACVPAAEETRELYEAESVEHGQECKKETQKRTCTAEKIWGEWSGTYTHKQCVVKEKQGEPQGGDCTANAEETRKRFEAATVAAGQTCKEEEQKRTCGADKKWGEWSGSYTHEACTVAAAPTQDPMANDAKVRFLHHSVGQHVWEGGVPTLVKNYNTANNKSYNVTEEMFPKGDYGDWRNYAFDYYLLWVDRQPYTFGNGNPADLNQTKLTDLVKDYNLVVWKHCFPMSLAYAEGLHGIPAENGDRKKSEESSIENYKWYYGKLKEEMRKHSTTRFLVWTPAVDPETKAKGMLGGDFERVKASLKRGHEFARWVRDVWDEKGDNIYVFDFYSIETGGGDEQIFMRDKFAKNNGNDAHPNKAFEKLVAPLFVQRMVDVLEGRGDTASVTGGAIPQ